MSYRAELVRVVRWAVRIHAIPPRPLRRDDLPLNVGLRVNARTSRRAALDGGTDRRSAQRDSDAQPATVTYWRPESELAEIGRMAYE
jgi:hypothetical protein